MSAPHTPSAPARLLLVEDAPDQAYVLKVLLEGLGPYTVTVVQDGFAALERIGAEAVDLVVTDLNLPGLDGFQLITDLHRHRPEMPVLAVTGSELPAHLEGARRAGARAVLVKPVDRQTLAEHVAALLGTSPAAPAGVDAGRPAGGVLAVAHRPGDLELGCGGALLAHAAAGEDVTVVVLTGPGDPEAAASRLGGTALPVSGTGAPAALRTLASWVRTRPPRLAYLPSPRDDDAARSVLFEATREALAGVPRILGYATPTTTLDFRPELFRDITDHETARQAAFRVLAEGGVSGLPAPDFLHAHARYWGRFAGHRPTEPFEILRDGTRS